MALPFLHCYSQRNESSGFICIILSYPVPGKYSASLTESIYSFYIRVPKENKNKENFDIREFDDVTGD
jgi:hypothetical protein